MADLEFAKSTGLSEKPFVEEGAELIVWQVVGTAAGHVAQTEGMARLLKEAEPRVRVQQVKAYPLFRGWQRGFLRWTMGVVSDRKVLAWMRRWHRKLDLPEGKPDILMTSGGEGMWLLEALGRHFGAMKVYVGMPMSFPKNWVDVLASPMAVSGYQRTIHTGRLLTAMNEELVRSAALASGNEEREKGLCAILIGGNSRSHQFTEEDWLALAEGVNALGAKGIRFLVTTSRRTGKAVEAILRGAIKGEYLVEAVWWGEEERKVVREFMGRSERVLVTRDSLTMLSEAIDSGRDVVAIVPKDADLVEGSNFTCYLESLSDEGWIETVTCSQVGGLALATKPTKAGIDFVKVAEDLLQEYEKWSRNSKDLKNSDKTTTTQ